MKIDRQSLEQSLRLIALGQLDPLQAARRLLGGEPTGQPQTQLPTLDALLRRLGSPPPDIENDWHHQIEQLADRWQQMHHRPLPTLQLTDLLIDAENRLSLRPGSAAAEQTRTPLYARHEPEPKGDQPKLDRREPDRHQRDCGSAAAGGNEPPWALFCGRRSAVVAATALIACAAATAYWFAARPDSPDRTPGGRADHLADHRERSSALAPASPRPLPEATAENAAAENGRRGSDSVPASAESEPGDSRAANEWGAANPLLSGIRSGGGPAGAPPAVASALPPAVTAEQPADFARAPRGDAAESTTAEAVTLPSLPALGQSSESELIFASPVDDLRWDFPVPASLSLRPLASGRWSLVDTTDDSELAAFQRSDEGLRFQWSETAASKSSARQVAAGRLQLSGLAAAGKTGAEATSLTRSRSKTLWLRPRLRPEPLVVEFSDSQITASWPLHGPPVYPAGELSVEVDVPETVDMSWIQPLDPQNLRRNVSLLQWTPIGAAAPAIRCRLELRATTQLSLNLRYAVQLDPSMPWQFFSAPQLANASDRLTLMLSRALVEQREVSRQYSAASTTMKRLIKPAKDRLDQMVLRLQTLVQWVQRLDALQASLAAGAEIRIGLTTQWPEGRQTILEMTRQE